MISSITLPYGMQSSDSALRLITGVTNVRSIKDFILGNQLLVKKVIEDSGVKFLLHDLRRTFATYADSLGIQHNTIKRLMNHKNNDVTSTHYIHQSIETLRDPMQKITEYILEKSK